MFSSRQIERASHTDVAVRFVCADTHPDRDTLCTFRRKNGALLQRAFAQILEMAAQCGVLQVGQFTVAIDGTKVLANASKHTAVSYDHAEQKLNDLEMEIKELLAKTEQADSTPLQDGVTIPDEVQRHEKRQAANNVISNRKRLFMIRAWHQRGRRTTPSRPQPPKGAKARFS